MQQELHCDRVMNRAARLGKGCGCWWFAPDRCGAQLCANCGVRAGSRRAGARLLPAPTRAGAAGV